MKYFFTCLICISLFFTAFGQQNLTLLDAIQLGLDNNFSIKIEQKRADITRNNNTIGQAGMLPNVLVNVGQNVSLTELDNPAGFLRAGSITGRTFNPAVALNWTLFNGFNILITKERLENLERQSLGNVQVIIENVVQSIILAYYLALLDQERTSVLKETLSLSSDRYQNTQSKVNIGTAVTFDLYQEKNAYFIDSSNYLQQQLNLRNAQRNLNLLMGVPVDQVYILTDKLLVDPKKLEYETLEKKMASNNANLKNQYINQQILRNDYGIARSAMFPRLDLNLNVNKSNQWQDLSDAEFAGGGISISEPVTSSTLNYTAGVTLSYTLYNGGRIRRQIENSRINEEIALLQTQELKASLKNNLINLIEVYEIRKTLLSLSEQNKQTTAFNLELAKERYQKGLISSFNFRDIQLAYLNASLAYLQAIFSLIDAESELMRLTGGITEMVE